jgi:hypothetical protein
MPTRSSTQAAVTPSTPGYPRPCCPRPGQRREQRRRVMHEVKQVIKPAARIGRRPAVKLGPHPAQPQRRPVESPAAASMEPSAATGNAGPVAAAPAPDLAAGAETEIKMCQKLQEALRRDLGLGGAGSAGRTGPGSGALPWPVQGPGNRRPGRGRAADFRAGCAVGLIRQRAGGQHRPGRASQCSSIKASRRAVCSRSYLRYNCASSRYPANSAMSASASPGLSGMCK